MKNTAIRTGKPLIAGAGLLALFLLAAPEPAQADEGLYCREYSGTAWIDGRARPAYGTACLQPDGAWRIVSQSDGDSIEYGRAPVVFRERVIESRPRIVEHVILRSVHEAPQHSWECDRHHGRRHGRHRHDRHHD